MQHPDEWLACELFDYLQVNGIISPDEEFEDWKYDRSDMIQMVEDELTPEEWELIENNINQEEL